MSVSVAIYLRISKDDAGTGLAIDRQRAGCERIAQERGWSVADVYVDDSLSAYRKNAKRPAYDRMVSDYAAGRFDALICYDLDRLTRQPRQLEDWIDAAEERGLLLVTANGEADLSTDNGRLFARIKASVARAEVERKGARQKAANAQRVASGAPVAGRRPFGWEKDGMTLRESEAEHVRQAHRMLLNGGTVRSVVRYLNAAGVLTSRGKQWGPTQVRKILLRARNAGHLNAYGAVVAESRIEPIVSAAEHEAVVGILSDPERTVQRGRIEEGGYLSGLLVCGVCGEVMRPKRLTMKGGRQRFYICASKLNGRADGSKHVSINGAKAERELPWHLFQALLMIEPDEVRDDAHDQLVALNAELAELGRQQEAAGELYLLPGANKGAVAKRLAELGGQAQDVQRRIARIHGESARIGLRGVLQDMAGLNLMTQMQDLQAGAQRFEEAFKAMPDEQKRELIERTAVFRILPGYGDRWDLKPYVERALVDQ